jgi:UDP-N-acetylmuramoylalanine--D-glutamate ligase
MTRSSGRGRELLTGRRVLVVGLGASGLSAARALKERGARVRVTELSSGEDVRARAEALAREGIDAEIGGHDFARLDAELAVVSPGIPPTAPVIEKLRRAGTELISEVELAYRLACCSFAAVTGTNGKTTTTSLLAAMLAESGVETVAAGNIGLPLIDAVKGAGPEAIIAAEISSFQLAVTRDFRPRVAVILNVAQDHIDWHGGLEAYVASKAQIVANQEPDDALVFNLEDARCVRIARAARSQPIGFSVRRVPSSGIGVGDGWVMWRERRLLPVEDVMLPGRAGLEDTLAASAAALLLGVDVVALKRAITSFRPLPHRLEVVGTVGGVAFIDDSKATNPHAALAAVAGLNDVVLIAGGRSKGMDLTPLKDSVPPVRGVIALGEARDIVRAVFSGLVPVETADSMADAVGRAAALAGGKGSVLLSPACASLDMYPSYAARGEDFARAARALGDAQEGRRVGQSQ